MGHWLDGSRMFTLWVFRLLRLVLLALKYRDSCQEAASKSRITVECQRNEYTSSPTFQELWQYTSIKMLGPNSRRLIRWLHS